MNTIQFCRYLLQLMVKETKFTHPKSILLLLYYCLRNLKPVI